MQKILISALLLFICLAPPADKATAQEIREIIEQKNISRMYDRALEFFTWKIPGEFEHRLNNSYKYIDLIKTVFGEKGIPNEIAYIPLVESGFSPVSIGPGDATGLWQFMKQTARKYGLRMDSYIDERRDPFKSTYAAAEYLRDLHDTFGKWDIALAAYNAGEGKIMQIGANGNPARLPAGICRYIARVLAAYTVAEDPEKYGFGPTLEQRKEAGDYTEITFQTSTSLKKIAVQYNTTVKVIKELNPALLRDETPPYAYTIRVPVN